MPRDEAQSWEGSESVRLSLQGRWEPRQGFGEVCWEPADSGLMWKPRGAGQLREEGGNPRGAEGARSLLSPHIHLTTE